MMCLTKYDVFLFVVSHSSVSAVELTSIYSFVAEKTGTKLSTFDKEILRKLLINIRKRWAKVYRVQERFVQDNNSWLHESLCLTQPIWHSLSGSSVRGRRPLPFEDKSHRSKLRATEDLRQESPRVLAFAAASSLQKGGRRTSARLVEAVASPGRGPAIAALLTTTVTFNCSFYF